MCGHFTLAAASDRLAECFTVPLDEALWQPSYNIAPTQSVLAMRQDGEPRASLLRWGLIPSWAKDASRGARLIN